MDLSGGSALDRALRDHHATVTRFLATVDALDEASWSAPWAEGKWTRAQVAEHIVLFYEVGIEALAGGVAMRPQLPSWMMRVLRWFLLPHVLFHRSIPVRAAAPRELRPLGRGLSRDETRELVGELATCFAEAVPAAHADPTRMVAHPYFGAVRPLPFLRFAAVHLEHHLRQIAPRVP